MIWGRDRSLPHFFLFKTLYDGIPGFQNYLNTTRDISILQLGINNHVFIVEDAQKVADLFLPYYTEIMSRIGRERGWPPLARQQFEYSRSPKGALMVGSVQQVIDKILYEHELFGFTRFMAHARLGTVPHTELMK